VDITSADWGKVSKALRVEDRPVSVLINNVGGITEPFMPFIEYSLEDHDRCSRLNIAPVLALTRLCLPHMLKRGAGRVLNVSSLSCYAPYLLSCYASDKAKLNALTESIAMELGGTGVAVNCAVSGLVSTPATRHISRFDAPSAERWAHDALAMFGAANTVYVPYWFHAVQAFFATNVPEALRFATASASIAPVQQHITRKSA
jgi:short-subunit dehydrogenase